MRTVLLIVSSLVVLVALIIALTVVPGLDGASVKQWFAHDVGESTEFSEPEVVGSDNQSRGASPRHRDAPRLAAVAQAAKPAADQRSDAGPPVTFDEKVAASLNKISSWTPEDYREAVHGDQPDPEQLWLASVIVRTCTDEISPGNADRSYSTPAIDDDDLQQMLEIARTQKQQCNDIVGQSGIGDGEPSSEFPDVRMVSHSDDIIGELNLIAYDLLERSADMGFVQAQLDYLHNVKDLLTESNLNDVMLAGQQLLFMRRDLTARVRSRIGSYAFSALATDDPAAFMIYSIALAEGALWKPDMAESLAAYRIGKRLGRTTLVPEADELASRAVRVLSGAQLREVDRAVEDFCRLRRC